MKKLLPILFMLFVHHSFGQRFYLYENNQPQQQKLDVIKKSKKSLTVRVYFESSERCACESSMDILLDKKSTTTFSGHPYDDSSKLIEVILVHGQVDRVVVKTDEYGCCSIVDGTYLRKKKKN